MAVALECINLIIPIALIQKKHPGGWQAYLAENPDLPSEWYDQHLLRLGAMNSLSIQLLVDDWKEKGFKPYKTINGIKHWQDMCVVNTFSDPTFPCAWLEFDVDRRTASLAESDRQNNLPLKPLIIMNDLQAQRLWSIIQSALDKGKPTWRVQLDALDQIPKAEKRKQKIIFSDADIFEGLLRSLLSNSVDWSKIQEIQDHLPELFEGYSFADYANKDENYVRTVLIHKFKDLGH